MIVARNVAIKRRHKHKTAAASHKRLYLAAQVRRDILHLVDYNGLITLQINILGSRSHLVYLKIAIATKQSAEVFVGGGFAEYQHVAH